MLWSLGQSHLIFHVSKPLPVWVCMFLQWGGKEARKTVPDVTNSRCDCPIRSLYGIDSERQVKDNVFEKNRFFLVIVLILVCQSNYFSTADQDSDYGVTCSTYANGWGVESSISSYVNWTAWGDFTAQLSASGKPVGYQVLGDRKLSAFVAGGNNPKDKGGKFTLTVKGWWIFKWGDSQIDHHYDSAGTYGDLW